MATLTNIAGVPRALPLINKKHVEFKKGESKDFPDADFAAIKDRASVKAHFTVEGVTPTAAAGDMKPDGQITLSTTTFEVSADAFAVTPPAKPSRAKKG